MSGSMWILIGGQPVITSLGLWGQLLRVDASYLFTNQALNFSWFSTVALKGKVDGGPGGRLCGGQLHSRDCFPPSLLAHDSHESTWEATCGKLRGKIPRSCIVFLDM